MSKYESRQRMPEPRPRYALGDRVKEAHHQGTAIVCGVFLNYEAARRAMSWLEEPEKLTPELQEQTWYFIHHELARGDVWSVRAESVLHGVPIPSGTMVLVNTPGLSPFEPASSLLEPIAVPCDPHKLFAVRLQPREGQKVGTILEVRRQEIRVAEPWPLPTKGVPRARDDE